MKWWIKARRAHTILPAGIICFLALNVIVQDDSIALPSIVGNTTVALSLFVPIPLLSGIMACLESRLPAPEASGMRAVALMDACLILVGLGISLLFSITQDLFLDLPLAGATGRNACFLAGLMLVGRAVMGTPAVMLPVVWILLAVFVGFRGQGNPYPWALIPEPATAFFAGVGAAIVFIVGILANLRSSRKPS